MRVKTINPITINTGMVSKVDANLYMEITEYDYQKFENLLAVGRYYYIDNGKEIDIQKFTKSFTKDQINQLYGIITPPVFTTKVAFDEEVAYLAGKVIMSQDYNIPMNNLEIVN